MAVLLCVLAMGGMAGSSAATAGAGRSGVAVATQGDAAEQLARRYAPVVRLREPTKVCVDGERYLPIDVEALMGDTGVAFRGPWRPRDLVKVGPTSADLRHGYFGYHLDFPGNALSPGCDYQTWGRRITQGRAPVTYARVVSEAGSPGKLALQYWFFYVFNDFNNLHEGDWEMIQLVFDAADAGEALGTSPRVVGYSQHSSAERAEWGSTKLERLDGTHPVVYAAEGSHANFFSSALYLGNSAAAGVGCDDTTAPHQQIRPRVAFVPTESSAYLESFPWLAFEGRWGEQQAAFYNGPTGPNLKEQWTKPIGWSQNHWRDESAAVPLGSTLGPNATYFFCGVVEHGSQLLLQLVRHPLPVLIALLLLVAAVLLVATRTQWTPSASHPLQQRRGWGQILTASWAVYRRHPVLFLAIGAIYVPLMAVAAGLEWLLAQVTELDTLSSAGAPNALLAFVVLVIGGSLSLAGYVCVLAAVGNGLAGLDEGKELSVRRAYRRVGDRACPLAASALILVAVVTLLVIPLVTTPLAFLYAVRHGFAVQSVMLEDRSALAGLRRSGELVRGHFWRVALLASLLVGVGATLGPLVGVAILLASNASLALVNLVSALIYAVTIPYVALGLTYLFFDLRARKEPVEPTAGAQSTMREDAGATGSATSTS